MPVSSSENLETATLGGGCFWCVEAVLKPLRGIRSVVSGYAGGHAENPTYQKVCSGGTGHAEVVQVTYDPDEISFRDILGVFFSTHNPTTLNRQGADVGSQYRSIILAHDDEQQRIAREVIAELEADEIFDDPIVTEVEPFEAFFEAEEKHQDYYERNAGQPYCQAVIAPKVAKMRKKYLDRLRPEAVEQ